jgi:hypothetical protein
LLVLRVAAPGFLAEPQCCLAHRQRLAQPAERIADAVDDMQGHDFFRKAVVVVFAAEMQFADRGDLVPGVAQPVVP